MMAKQAMLEAAVMDVLWDSGAWLSPGQVLETLHERRPLAYTTVMTVLVRLWKKERVERRRRGRAYEYRPLQTREEFAAARMDEALRAARDQSLALAHFVDTLQDDERAELRRRLQR
jgi:predicted transcriptional regulator